MIDFRITLVIYAVYSTLFLLLAHGEAIALPSSLVSYEALTEDGKIKLVKYRNRSQSSTEARSGLNQNLYHQNAGVDPAGWLLGGQALDAAASSLARPYYEQYGYHSVPRNYVYYDWGW